MKKKPDRKNDDSADKRTSVHSDRIDSNELSSDSLKAELETRTNAEDDAQFAQLIKSLSCGIVAPPELKTRLMNIPNLALGSGQAIEDRADENPSTQQEADLRSASKHSPAGASTGLKGRLAIALSLTVSLAIIWLTISFTHNDVPSVAESSTGSKPKTHKTNKANSTDIASKIRPENDSPKAKPEKQQTNEKSTVLKDAIDEQLQIQLAATEEMIDSANLRLQELEIERLKAKLQSLRPESQSRISSREFESIASAIAAEATENFGGSEELARTQLSLVVDEYPSSPGSKIAVKHLQHLLQ